MFSSLGINRLIMVYLKDVICYKASVFFWAGIVLRIGYVPNLAFRTKGASSYRARVLTYLPDHHAGQGHQEER